MLGVAVPPTAAAGRRVADPCIIAKATVHVFLRTAAMLFCSLLCAECGSPKPLKRDCRIRMQKAFSLPRSCTRVLRAGKKTLKRAKATVHVFLRTAAMLFCSLLCAECGSPKPLKRDCRIRMQKAFSLPRSCTRVLRAGKKTLKRAKATVHVYL